jgi:hypothetical protein
MANIRKHEYVRIVEANGCMAHRLENPRHGVVEKVVHKKLGGGNDTLWPRAQIRLLDGTLTELPAEVQYWTPMEDGVATYWL